MQRDLETKLNQIVKQSFGEESWNYKHTLLAVEWMRKLLENEQGDSLILITTMYLHDIGYSNILKKGYSFDERETIKKKHMEIGAQYALNNLPNLGYTEQETERIAHLISVHDNVEILESPDEILVMEADSLAMITWDKLKPSYNREDRERFMERFESRRLPKFRSKSGIRYVNELLIEAKRLNTIFC